MMKNLTEGEKGGMSDRSIREGTGPVGAGFSTDLAHEEEAITEGEKGGMSTSRSIRTGKGLTAKNVGTGFSNDLPHEEEDQINGYENEGAPDITGGGPPGISPFGPGLQTDPPPRYKYMEGAGREDNFFAR